MARHCTDLGFRVPMQFKFSDKIDLIDILIGFKHDGPLHCGIRGYSEATLHVRLLGAMRLVILINLVVPPRLWSQKCMGPS